MALAFKHKILAITELDASLKLQRKRLQKTKGKGKEKIKMRTVSVFLIPCTPLASSSPLFIQPATKKCIGWIFTLVVCRNSKGQPPVASH